VRCCEEGWGRKLVVHEMVCLRGCFFARLGCGMISWVDLFECIAIAEWVKECVDAECH
jgi:hypothetical protein